MQVFKLTIILGWLLAEGTCSLLLRHQDDTDTNGPDYLFSMCLPSEIPALPLESPFPCEVYTFLDTMCSANASTKPNDLLYEQECICNGVYFDVLRGCNNCLFVHGVAEDDPSDSASMISSLSAAECNAGPPTTPFSNLWPDTRTVRPPAITSVKDQFPNNTAVSNYWTASRNTVTLGAFTKSTTGALQTASRAPGALVTSGAGKLVYGAPTNSTSSPSPSAAKNVAAVGDVQMSTGLLTILITLVVLNSV